MRQALHDALLLLNTTSTDCLAPQARQWLHLKRPPYTERDSVFELNRVRWLSGHNWGRFAGRSTALQCCSSIMLPAGPSNRKPWCTNSPRWMAQSAKDVLFGMLILSIGSCRLRFIRIPFACRRCLTRSWWGGVSVSRRVR